MISITLKIKDIIVLESLSADGISLPSELDYSALSSQLTIPKNLEDLVKQNQIGLVMLKVVEIIGEDKINDLAKCLFTLNNRRYGPIPGAYMVMCTKPGKEWCVGQLNADRAKPFVLFEDKVFSSSEEAQKEAERIKKDRGESAPRRCT